MKLVVVILILLAAWLVYSILQSYRNMEYELREIRMKCIKESAVTSSDDRSRGIDPTEKMTSSLVSLLQMVKNYST
jgi:hypothetical protein